jgi:hypothetical protein
VQLRAAMTGAPNWRHVIRPNTTNLAAAAASAGRLPGSPVDLENAGTVSTGI